MSFLSDLFGGNIGNLGNDLAPSNIFSDTQKDIGGSNTLEDLGLLAGGLAIAAPFALPALEGLDATGLAATTATEAAPFADLGAANAALPAAATLDAGTVPASIADEFATAFPGSAGAAGTAGGTVANAAPATWLDSLTAAPTGVATGGTAFTTPAAAQPGIFQGITNAFAPVGNAIKSVAPELGVAGLGYNIYQGIQTNNANKALAGQEAANAANAANISATDQAAAGPLLSSGEVLTQYLSTGTLPQAFQSQVDQQVAAAKASIIQGYASRGQNSDPNKNSALAQDLANVDAQALTLKSNLEATLNTAGTQLLTTANGLLQSGLSATQLAAELPIQVSQLNSQLNQAMATSISNFAAALNGSVPNKNAITLNLPQNVVGSTGTLNV